MGAAGPPARLPYPVRGHLLGTWAPAASLSEEIKRKAHSVPSSSGLGISKGPARMDCPQTDLDSAPSLPATRVVFVLCMFVFIFKRIRKEGINCSHAHTHTPNRFCGPGRPRKRICRRPSAPRLVGAPSPWLRRLASPPPRPGGWYPASCAPGREAERGPATPRPAEVLVASLFRPRLGRRRLPK